MYTAASLSFASSGSRAVLIGSAQFEAGAYGGALYLTHCGSFFNCRMTGNRAVASSASSSLRVLVGGGALMCGSDGLLVMRSSVVADNRAQVNK